MGSEELRLASFCEWLLAAVVRPEWLAAAGFFYTGQQDKMRCFFCCGGLQSWEQGDDPWTEHAEWFPRCEFLLQTGGRDFVCSVEEARCHPLGSWDRLEEPEDGPLPSPPVSLGACPVLCSPDAFGPTHGAGDSQEWSARCQCPAVQAVLCMGFGPGRMQNLLQRKYGWAGPADLSTSWLVADLLQKDDGDGGPGTKAPVHTGPELPTPRREAQSEGAREPGAGYVGEQLRRLQEERTCKVRLDRAVGTVFVPCGQLIWPNVPRPAAVPRLQGPIRSCVRTFLS